MKSILTKIYRVLAKAYGMLLPDEETEKKIRDEYAARYRDLLNFKAP